jgi:transposase
MPRLYSSLLSPTAVYNIMVRLRDRGGSRTFAKLLHRQSCFRDDIKRWQTSDLGSCATITDFEWSVIEPLFPKDQRGVKPKNSRRVLNGIFWVLRAGAPWRDLPERYGSYPTAYNRFNRWRTAGIWDRLMDAIVRPTTGRCR